MTKAQVEDMQRLKEYCNARPCCNSYDCGCYSTCFEIWKTAPCDWEIPEPNEEDKE